jgi:hypothetical protein
MKEVGNGKVSKDKKKWRMGGGIDGRDFCIEIV